MSSALGAAERDAATQRMLSRQHHRGPDAAAFASFSGASLGTARLSIIDPASGHQPMHSPDGRYHLAFNGALVNHREIFAKLQAHWAFRTSSDTEVLLAAFVRHGPSVVHHLRGMFAFAVWDSAERTLFAARDALGIKPFYYAPRSEGGVVFASELNALVASRLVEPEIDAASVTQYLAWLSVPAPRTIYRGVVSLPPGHCLTVDAEGRIRTAAWWTLPEHAPSEPVAKSREDFDHELRERLNDTIRAHRVADVPVGAFLSGGLDSTAVTALMVQGGATSLSTFSIGFEETAFAEQAHARAAAQHLGTHHTEEILSGARVAREMPAIIAALDQPSGDGINTYYASQLAHRAGLKVVLSGLGGDELFGSYPSFQTLPRLERLLGPWRRLPKLTQPIGALLARHPQARVRKLGDFLQHARDLHELASLGRRVLSESARFALLSPEARTIAERQGPHHPLVEELAFALTGADAFQVVSAWELRTYMTDVLLRDSDVMSMAHSLELRVPFVDTELLGWLWRQPTRFKYDPLIPKRALADAVRDIVPESIRSRQKQGFTLPFALWMRRELRPFLDDVFSTSSLAKCPWLDARQATNLWLDFLRGRDSGAWSRVWTVAVLIAFANRPANLRA